MATLQEIISMIRGGNESNREAEYIRNMTNQNAVGISAPEAQQAALNKMMQVINPVMRAPIDYNDLPMGLTRTDGTDRILNKYGDLTSNYNNSIDVNNNNKGRILSEQEAARYNNSTDNFKNMSFEEMMGLNNADSPGPDYPAEHIIRQQQLERAQQEENIRRLRDAGVSFN